MIIIKLDISRLQSTKCSIEYGWSQTKIYHIVYQNCHSTYSNELLCITFISVIAFFTFSSNRTFLYLDITNIAKLHGILTVIAKSNQHLNVVVLCFMSFSSACGAYSVIMVHTFLVKNGNELYKEEIENTSEELNINFKDVYSHTSIMQNVDGGR